MRTAQRFVSILALLAIVAGAFLPACAGPLTPTQAPTQPPATPTAATTAAASTSTPQKAPTQAATATSQPAGPPTIVARTPARGEELKPGQPIILSFDQPMDEASVKAAVSIQPPVEGTWTFKGNDAIFTPAKTLERGQVYQVSLTENAKSAAGLTLGKPAVFKMQTVGYLEVTTAQPADQAQDVAADTTIMVVFNRPVVPLTSLEAQKGLPQPLTIEPAVKGEGAWINTSIYAFRPSEPLAAATIYRATLKAGLADLSGALLAEDYVWSFSTAQPKVLEVTPKGEDGGTAVPPTQVISMTFNLPMDKASTEAAFKLTSADGKQTIAGAFTWADDGRSFRFKPAQALSFAASYKATLAAGAKSANGNGRLADETTWQFAVVSLPKVTRTQPANGAKTVTVGGGVEVWFTSPLDEKTIGPNLTILPKPTNVYTYYAEYESRLWISFDRKPQTDYTVTLGGKIADPYGNSLGQDYVLRFRTGDWQPSVSLNTPGVMGTYSTYTETRLTVSHMNASSLTYALYNLPLERLAALNEDSWSLRDYAPSDKDLIRKTTIELNTPLNTSGLQNLSLSNEPGKALPAGAYFLTVTAPEIERSSKEWRPPSHVLIVSPYNMVMKSGSTEALVWVTDLGSGKPAAGVPVRLLDSKNVQVGAGTTDANGLFRASYAQRDLWESLLAIAGAPGANFGVVSNRWYEGITPWDFNLNFGQYQANNLMGYLYTDRPIYRPGQSIHFKGIVRKDDDAQYALPADLKAVDISVWDGQGNQVYTSTMTLNAMGSFEGVIELSEAAGLGYYRIDARLNDSSSIGADFQVAEYRKPEFEVTVTTDAADYLAGDTINVTVQANYYFGGPVRDAQVRWTLLRKDYWFNYTGEGWYDFNDIDWWADPRESVSSESLGNQTGKTDAQGRFTFTVPADISKQKISQIFTLDVAITDVNDQEVASRADVTVHKGAYYIGLRPKEYVSNVDSQANIEIITVDKDSKPAPNQTLQVVANATRWDNVQEEGTDGRLYWVSKVLETPVFTATVQTDAAGKGTFSFTPKAGGTYRVRAIGRDAKEHEIRSSTFVWVSGRKDEYVSWRRENNNRMTLVSDRKEYKPGDTAEILIPSPYQGAVQALVTIERGKLLDVKTITLNSNSERISIPITEAHVPNIFVSVVIVKGQDATEPLGSMRVGYLALPVSSESKKLKVEISSDKKTYQPGDQATFKVRATDWTGKPAQAEFSLSLVDLAVLALGGANQADMFQTFWYERGVGFYTAGSLIVAVDRLTKAVEAERAGAKGGGGGGQMGDAFVRREFADTAYWNPIVTTDQNGEASVTIKLPDNLTTWRLDARGVTTATQVGLSTYDVVSNKPLMVRPVLPRFFVIGDQGQISAIVHNNTDKEVEATLTMAVSGLDTKDPLTQKIKVPAGDLARLSWNVTARAAEEATVRFSAQGGGLADAVETTLPLYHPSTPEVVATAGQLDAAGQQTETIILPEVLDAARGELTVSVAPSLAAGMRDGLNYLEHYPYECVEQTVSRFLPNVLSYSAMKKLGVQNAELETRLPQMVGVALQRLYSSQHFDGGWGWWVSGESNDYLTAYVLYGLSEAHKAGFLVDKNVMERAATFVSERMPSINLMSNTWELNREVFKLYALADYSTIAGVKVQELSRAVQLYENRDKLGLWAQALLGLSFALLDPKEESRIDTLISDLTSKAVVSATGAHWEEAVADWHNMNTDTRTTAIVLSLLARRDPQNALGANAVRWLMTVRTEGRWESTYETTWALLGLTDWMVATGELDADYKYAVMLNGETLKEGAANKSNVAEKVELRAAVKDLLLDQPNRLVLEREAGRGRLYYTADLQYYLPADKIKALDRGIVISRDYRLYENPDKPLTEVKVGDIIQVRLTIIAPNDLHFVVVEDPLPAGCEAVDVSLKTTSAALEGPSLEKTDATTQPWWRWWWDSWWSPSHSEMRDEKVALFAETMGRGSYQYTYLMRATLAGEFLVIPTTAYEMYFPEVFGRSDGTTFTIGR